MRGACELEAFGQLPRGLCQSNSEHAVKMVSSKGHALYTMHNLLFTVVCASIVLRSDAFIGGPSHVAHPSARPLWATVRDIKEELVQRGVKFDDCFDKESLIQRLQDARDGKIETVVGVKTKEASAQPGPVSEQSTTQNEEGMPPKSTISNTEAFHHSDGKKSKELDREATLKELRGMRVKELRQELASRKLRWAGLLEKEDLVQAVLQARIQAANFSSTGLIVPGQVATLTGLQVKQEAKDESIEAPLLVDAFALWCGPCQMMAPQLQSAAEVWGDKIRVAKFDTDKHPAEASEWRVQGLPTLLLFHKGQQLARIEGALMKDQLLQWVESELTKA